MTAYRHGASDPQADLRADLLSALEREGIAYPPERMDEALVEYVQLRRLMAVVEAATRPGQGAAMTAEPAPGVASSR